MKDLDDTGTPPCKPCWELKYCPYGAFVEWFPLMNDDEDVGEVRVHNVERTREIGQFLGLPKLEDWLEFLPRDVRCSVFGHACPVFFVAEPLTETVEERSISGRIPTRVKIAVDRRDRGVCQICSCNVLDDQKEFDHIIPKSKGGPSTESNIRLTCSTCNRKKGNDVGIALRRGLHNLTQTQEAAFDLLCQRTNESDGLLHAAELDALDVSRRDMQHLVKQGWVVKEGKAWRICDDFLPSSARERP